jgi:hypothetical protein
VSNEEKHTFYASPNIVEVIKSRMMGLAGHVARMGEMRNAYKIFPGNPEGKRPLRRPKCRGGNNVRMNLREVDWEGVDWIHLAQDRDQRWSLVNTELNI